MASGFRIKHHARIANGHWCVRVFSMSSGLQGSLMVDVAGTWLTSEDRHFLRQPEVGGLIIFARNIEHPRQVRELSAAIRAVRPDLLLAVDQEGGRVQRLRQGFVRLQ
ncbi:Beta-hexosaminidase, partial [Pseudomonas savastanoi pv. glycinea]